MLCRLYPGTSRSGRIPNRMSSQYSDCCCYIPFLHPSLHPRISHIDRLSSHLSIFVSTDYSRTPAFPI